MISADVGNYENRRVEGMIDIPIVDDRIDCARIAGEWTKSAMATLFDETTGRESIDGRDLWSGRISPQLEAIVEKYAGLLCLGTF